MFFEKYGDVILISAGIALASSVTILIAAVLIISYVCYRMTFYSKPRDMESIKDKIVLPEGEIYEVFRDEITGWINKMRSIQQIDVEITSFDGLKLRGKYFEQKKGAPIELLMHGYKGFFERDLNGGIFRCFALGRNALLVDHRAHGHSEGHVISFGINESRDCADWTKFIAEHIDPNAPIFIGGVSMGAATAMMASARDIHPNVVGILADCGYSSAKEIIKKVIGEMHLPADICYPFVKLGARLYGHFDLEEISPKEAMKTCKLPIIFIHGDADAYVPHGMSVENYEACASKHKKMVTIEGAGHGVAFPAAQERYIREVREFFDGALKDKE